MEAREQKTNTRSFLPPTINARVGDMASFCVSVRITNGDGKKSRSRFIGFLPHRSTITTTERGWTIGDHAIDSS